MFHAGLNNPLCSDAKCPTSLVINHLGFTSLVVGLNLVYGKKLNVLKPGSNMTFLVEVAKDLTHQY